MDGDYIFQEAGVMYVLYFLLLNCKINDVTIKEEGK